MVKGSKHKEETKKAISERMEGKVNAEKWTCEVLVPILENFCEILENDKNNDYILINDLLKTRGLYKDIWNDWTEKFKDNETISLLIKRIESDLESKIFSNAIKGKYNSAIAIFGLKNKYGWKDKFETENKHIVEKDDYSKLSDEEVLFLTKLERKRLGLDG